MKKWAVAALLAVLACGCTRKDRDELGQAGRKAAGHFKQVLGGPDGKLFGSLDALRGGLAEGGIDSRVSTRLHWDAPLRGAVIRVSVARPGVVLLAGSVPSAELRQRAIDLAAATRGVELVMDTLEVKAPESPKKAG